MIWTFRAVRSAALKRALFVWPNDVFAQGRRLGFLLLSAIRNAHDNALRHENLLPRYGMGGLDPMWLACGTAKAPQYCKMRTSRMATLRQRRTEDVDDQASALFGWNQHYEQLGCGNFRGSVSEMVMADGVLYREHTNRKLWEEFSAPADHLTLVIPLAVEAGSIFAGQSLNRETLMVLSSQEAYEVLATGELGMIGLSVRRSVLEGLLDPANLEWLALAERRRGVELAPDDAAAVRCMLLGVEQQATCRLDFISEREHELEVLSSALTRVLLHAMSGDRGHHVSIIPRRVNNRRRIAKRAIDFMRSNLDGDIGVPEICAAAFASRRTLQYCFEEFTHTTPQAYLRALRLNEARRALRMHSDQSITGLAFKLGFSSCSHFTRHYKQMFEELPSATLKQAPI